MNKTYLQNFQQTGIIHHYKNIKYDNKTYAYLVCDFLLFRSDQTAAGTRTGGPFFHRQSGRDVKLTAFLNLVWR